MPHLNTISLIVGSALCSSELIDKDLSKSKTIAINNAWRIREDFDYCIYPTDFPEEKRPPSSSSIIHIDYDNYMQGVVAAGGITFAGATMAYATGYWALHCLKPTILGFYGCDMVYSPIGGNTHFYGTGTPDPLRTHPTLRSLEAKSCRLFLHALNGGALCLNFSAVPGSKLTFPAASLEALELDDEHLSELTSLITSGPHHDELIAIFRRCKSVEAEQPFEGGTKDGYFEIGRDPENLRFLDAVDDLWLTARDAQRGLQSQIALSINGQFRRGD